MPALSKRKQQLKKLAANKKKEKEDDDEAGSAAAAAPSAARGSPEKEAVRGRPPKRKDANPRVKRRADQITCAEAAAAGLAKPLGERPYTGIERLALQAGKPFVVCCCPLCFLCLLLSDDIQKLAFINAVYSKKKQGRGQQQLQQENEEGKAAAAKAASDTQTGIFGKQEEQQQQQMQQ